MTDIRVYSYKEGWAKQIDELLGFGINRNDIEGIFHDVVVERERVYQQEYLRKEAQREVSAIAEQYMKDRYGDAAERNYCQKDYDALAIMLLDHIDKSMEELQELERQGYRKVDDWSDAELAMDGILREDGGSSACSTNEVRRRRVLPSRVVQNSPEKVLADFVKNL
jgi:hypothetical protein